MCPGASGQSHEAGKLSALLMANKKVTSDTRTSTTLIVILMVFLALFSSLQLSTCATPQGIRLYVLTKVTQCLTEPKSALYKYVDEEVRAQDVTLPLSL